MALQDGNGWVECRCGQRHWGLNGAAGLVLTRPGEQAPGRSDAAPGGSDPAGGGTDPADDGSAQVLLQLRADWTHQGGTWGVPGGARDSHEDAVSAALREAGEETGVPPDRVRVVGQVPGVEHVDWSYVYVLAVEAEPVGPLTLTEESHELRWVPVDGVGALGLHPAFAAAWPGLRAALLAVRALP